MKIVAYRILTATSADALEDQVTQLIINPDDPMDDSWQPHGPLIVERLHAQNRYSGSSHMDTLYDLRFIQAMVRVA